MAEFQAVYTTFGDITKRLDKINRTSAYVISLLYEWNPFANFYKKNCISHAEMLSMVQGKSPTTSDSLRLARWLMTFSFRIIRE